MDKRESLQEKRESLWAYNNKKESFLQILRIKAIKPTRPVPKASILHSLVLHSTGGYGKLIIQTGLPFWNHNFIENDWRIHR